MVRFDSWANEGGLGLPWFQVLQPAGGGNRLCRPGSFDWLPANLLEGRGRGRECVKLSLGSHHLTLLKKKKKLGQKSQRRKRNYAISRAEHQEAPSAAADL
jgi:hypothetical protein